MKFLRSLFIASRFFFALWSLVILCVIGFFSYPFFVVAQAAAVVLLLLTMSDAYLLYAKGSIDAKRILPNRLSNGDLNDIRITVNTLYPFPVSVEVIDELPEQFQMRDFSRSLKMHPLELKQIHYQLRPVERGEYLFGEIHAFVASPLHLLQKRFSFSQTAAVPVYPSFIQMKKIELLAISDRLQESGIKKIRKIGRSTEFDQIKDYVAGDDYRTLNWKATARRNKLMVNHYDDEKAQQVYSVIDMSRAMKMPFDSMTLLDYAINAGLAISKIVMQKHDKAGIVTFSNKVNAIIPADNRATQMAKIQECLYRQTTDFFESDYEALAMALLTKINHRSLIILYTNFETLESMRRQLPYLRRLAANHIITVVFFENTELSGLLSAETKTTEDIYIKTIAEKFAYEKRQIAKELALHKIHVVLTPPAALSVNTINKYLELKARNLI